MAKLGKFWSADGELAYRRVYEEARALWPEHEVRRVPTDHGSVQTLIVRARDAAAAWPERAVDHAPDDPDQGGSLDSEARPQGAHLRPSGAVTGTGPEHTLVPGASEGSADLHAGRAPTNGHPEQAFGLDLDHAKAPAQDGQGSADAGGGSHGDLGADATPIVLLHGMSCTSLMWRPNVEALAAERTVIAIDAVVDCGGSHQSAPVTDLDGVVASVVQTLDGLGVDRAHVVGLSYGGWTAAGLALKAPHRVASTTLLEPGATLHPIRAAYLLGFAASFFRPSPSRWKHLFARRPGDDLIALLDASRRYWPAAPLPTVFSDDDLSSLAGALQMVLGARSTTSDPARTRARLGSLLPRAELHVVPAAGHILSADAPDAVNRLVLDFIAAAEKAERASLA